MHRLRIAFMAGATVVSMAAGAGAQQRGPGGVPAGFMPPAGMCRVWFDGVAPGRQPAPTDCATARVQLRPNSRILYGAALRTNDPRGPYGNAGAYDPRESRRGDGRYDGRYDRMSDHQRRELEKDRRKREKEREKAWKKAHKHHGHHDADDDEDDDDDDDERGGDRRDRGNRGVYGQGGVNQGGVNQGGVIRGGTYDPRTGNRGGCVDANHDGVCDPQQGGGAGRVRIP